MKMHYRISGFGGFTSDECNVDLNEHVKRFERVEGDMNSDYAVRLLKSNIAHSYYSEMFFSNDLSECESKLRSWLSQKYEREWVMEDHLYGNILDVKHDEELGYGDAWSGSDWSWHEWSGLNA